MDMDHVQAMDAAQEGGKLLTAKDLQELFQVSESQVWRWYHGEGLPYLKLERKCIRFRWEDVEQWMLSRRCVSRSA